MKKIFTLLAFVLATVSSYAVSTETVFNWRSDGATTTLEKALTATGGTATFYGTEAPSTESVAYNEAVTDNDLKATGSKAHKLGKNTLYLELKLSSGNFKAGDVIQICGYNPFRVGTGVTDNRADTDIAASLATGTGKADYNVGSVTLPDDFEETNVIYISRANGSGTGVAAVKVTREVLGADDPVVEVSPTTLSLVATIDEPSVSGTFQITGSNMFDLGMVNVTCDDTNLSLSATAIPVTTQGTVDQNITVSYNPTVNADPTTAEIIITAGSITKKVTVTYSALVEKATPTNVTGDITWDIEKDITGDADVASPTEEIYANLLGLTFADDFDATSLYVTANDYAWRKSNKCAQACTLKFITEVPGTITVTFSNTGGSNKERWVKVTDANGEQTGTVEAVGTTHMTESFDVAAGTVSITGTGALRFFKIEFVKANGVSVTIPASGYATLCSSNDVVSNGECYKATKLVNGVVTIVPVQGVIPASTGIIVKGEAGTVTLPIATEGTTAADLEGNKMVGVLADTDMTGKSCYILSDGAFWPCSGGTLAAGKAYLDIAPTSGAKAIEIDVDGQETAISTVNAEQLNGNIYTINGVQVKNAQLKGIYIINGKKVVK